MRSRWSVLAIMATSVATVTAACSGGPAPEYSPDAAAAEVQRTLGPTTQQLECLRRAFQADPSIAAVFNLDERATDSQRRAYIVAIRGCIPVAELGQLLGKALSDPDQPSAVGTIACVGAAVVSMSTTDQDNLYLYFSHPATVAVDAITPAIRVLTDACGLDKALAPPSGSSPPGSANPGSVP